jgi:hypothetical protein
MIQLRKLLGAAQLQHFAFMGFALAQLRQQLSLAVVLAAQVCLSQVNPVD